MQYPQWATPERRALLVELFGRTRLVDIGNGVQGFCMDTQCRNASELPYCADCPRYYLNYIEPIIKGWIAEDKVEQAELWRRERRMLHQAIDKRGWRKQVFDPVAKDQFFSQQPMYYLEAVGISGLTFTPIAKARVASTPVRLFVDVPRSKRKMSKNARHKALRYGRGRLVGEDRTIAELCNLAVKDFWRSIT